MLDALVIAALLSIVVVSVATRRRQRGVRRAAATTVSLRVTGERIERELADGRHESANLSRLGSIELVRTPVRTADGATAFLLLGESEEAGCLVPLGVGLESQVLAALTTLPGFRVERLNAALEQRAPHREVIWERQPPG